MGGRGGWISYISGILVGLGAMMTGCAGETEQAPVLADVASTSTPSIFGGAVDDDDRSAVVALRVGAGGTFELCTGALIAPNVVLTARHCVTSNVTSSVSCDENGRSANGKHIARDQEPRHVGVYVGSRPKFSEKPDVVATAIVSPDGDVLCDSDIALVVLERDVEGVEPLPVRLGSTVGVGETIRSVGYGQNDKRLPIGTRFRRESVSVLAMGRAVSASKTPLGEHEFEVGESICQGDSGGPAISEETGAVVGVVSRGGGCDEDFGHIYTTTSGFEDLFDRAFAIAGGAPLVETGGPDGASSRPRSRTGGGTRELAGDPSASSCAAAPGALGGGAGSFAAAPGLALALALTLRRRRSA